MTIEVSNLDHLGLVAGVIDEIGIVEKINELLGEHKSEKISAGQVVKGMILNGLGLVYHRYIYLVVFLKEKRQNIC